MLFKWIRTFRHALLVLAVFLLLLTGVCTLVLPLPGALSAFAAVRQAPTATCRQVPSVAHCYAKDPEDQQCASSAVTTAHALIVSHGRTVGRVERRYSPKCQSWWGRIYSYETHLRGQFTLQLVPGGTAVNSGGYQIVGFPQFRSSAYTILYSDMFFDDGPTFGAPEIIGTFPPNGDVVGLSAAIPAAAAPTK